jgi:hypothetical protein
MHFGILRLRQRPRCSTSKDILTKTRLRNPPSDGLSEGGFLFASSHLFARAGRPMSYPGLGGGYQFDPMDRVDFGIAQVAVGIDSSLALSRSASVIPMLRPC